MQRLENRYQQLGGTTAIDERIDDAITAYLNESDHFCERVNSVIEDWAEKMDINGDISTHKIERAVKQMIDNGEITVSLDTM